MGIEAFVERYFIEPVMSSQGYNVYNTIVYAVLFIAGLYLAFNFLKRIELRPGEKLFWSLVPFVFLGGVVRALGQLTYVRGEGLLPPSFWFFTPGIYVLIASFTFISLLVCFRLRGKEYQGLMQLFGTAPTLIGLLYIFTQATNFRDFIIVILGSMLVGLVLYFSLKGFAQSLLTKSNLLIISGFVLDTTTTTIASAYFGYVPEHVLTGIISSANPFLFLPFKLILILAALYYIESDSNENEKWILRLALLILGLPHGVHDSLQILMGV
jgi:uncharacterized membrane protein